VVDANRRAIDKSAARPDAKLEAAVRHTVKRDRFRGEDDRVSVDDLRDKGFDSDA
jgi:hypothetical protein